MVFKLFGSALNLLRGANELTKDESSLMRQNFQRAAFSALKSPKVFIFGVGEYGLRSMVSIDNEWLLEITGYGLLGACGFAVLLAVPIVYSIKGILTAQKQGNSANKLLFKCTLIMFLEYTVALYTVAQMAEARMFYILLGITCSYSIKLKKAVKK